MIDRHVLGSLQEATDQPTRSRMWTRRSPAAGDHHGRFHFLPQLSLLPSRDSIPAARAVVATAAPCESGNEFSWEEQTFAQLYSPSWDLGCVWPPRSYSCSFCGREFRSAQALGGHMNIHRRDRARLRALSPPPTPSTVTNCSTSSRANQESVFLQPQSYPYTSHEASVPNPTNGCDSDCVLAVVTSPQLSSRNIASQPSPSSTAAEAPSIDQPPYKRPFSAMGMSLQVPDLKREVEDLKQRSKGSFSCRGREGEGWEAELQITISNSKRQRSEDVRLRHPGDLVLPFPTSLGSIDRRQHSIQHEIMLKPEYPEELDLELRLGDRPNNGNCVKEH